MLFNFINIKGLSALRTDDQMQQEEFFSPALFPLPKETRREFHANFKLYDPFGLKINSKLLLLKCRYLFWDLDIIRIVRIKRDALKFRLENDPRK
jgi:hypothetical protein